MTELCERYGISRKTGYKWLERFEAEEAVGLEDRSRAPRSCPHRMSEEVRGVLLRARRRYPTWGPRKLLAWLEARAPSRIWPSAERERGGRSPAARGSGATAASPAGSLAPSGPRTDPHAGRQRALDRRLQGSVPHP